MTGTLFTLTFLVAAPFWALMILAPRWSWTARIIGSPLIVLPPLVIYVALVIPAFGEVLPAVLSPTLGGVRDLLGTANGAAAAWAHMIAFDLFAGRWAWLDSRERGVPALVMAPVLLLTILLGPVGLLVYLMVRARYAPAPLLPAPLLSAPLPPVAPLSAALPPAPLPPVASTVGSPVVVAPAGRAPGPGPSVVPAPAADNLG